MELTKSHRAYFKAAKVMSEVAESKRAKLGCIAVYAHRIISSGCNSTKTSPIQKKYNIHRFEGDAGEHTLHAEVQCLLPLIGRNDIDFSKISLYIYREHKNGELALARPCASCMALIKDLKIKKIYYTNNNGFSCEEILR